jgi:hypothetical protein
MSGSIFVLVLAMLACGSAFSAEHGRHVLPPERHAIEAVHPPYSGSHIISGARFVAETAACAAWNAGERMPLLSGDRRGRCVEAVFHNAARHRASCLPEVMRLMARRRPGGALP